VKKSKQWYEGERVLEMGKCKIPGKNKRMQQAECIMQNEVSSMVEYRGFGGYKIYIDVWIL
jgi:hypothetical protein